MREILRRRLKQTKPLRSGEEALLNLMIAGAWVQSRLERVCARHGVTHRQYNVLRILRGAHPRGHPRREIAVRMIDPVPDVTRLIDRLQRGGLAARVPSGKDRRQSITRITPRGMALLKKMDPEMDREGRAMIKRLTALDCLRLSTICEALYGPGE
jgi:DNA-binding MarR family transcriptional regulator